MYKIFFIAILTGFSQLGYSQETDAEALARLSAEIVDLSNKNKKIYDEEQAAINKRLANKEISKEDARELSEGALERFEERSENDLNRKLEAIQLAAERISNMAPPPPPDGPEASDMPEAPPPPDFANDGDEDDDDADDDDDCENCDDDNWGIHWKDKKKSKSESSTTSQFVFAFGLNNLINNKDLSTFDNDQFKLSNSRFYEWGLTGKARLLKNSSFLQLKYGVSLIYNNLRPANNTYFAQPTPTGLVLLTKSSDNFVKEPYFRTVQWTVPVHLEFDFSKSKSDGDRIILKSQQGVRAGIGGYAGLVSRVRQHILSKNDSNQEIETTIKGGYETNDFVYGVSGYIGYKDISLYTKLDLNPLFKSNELEQNNLSIGLRFDLH